MLPGLDLLSQSPSLRLPNLTAKWLDNPVLALQGYQASQQVLSLAFSILMAKVLRDTAQIGFYEMLVFLAFLLSYFWLTGIGQSFMRSTDAEDPDRYGKWLYTCLLLTVISVGVFGILLVGQKQILPLLLSQPRVPFLGEYIVFLVLTIPTNALPLLWVLESKARSIWWFATGSWIAKFLAMAIPLLAGYGLGTAIHCLVIAGVLMQGMLWLVLWNKRSKIGRWKWFATIGRGSLPLILYAMIGALAIAVDSVLIGKYYGDERVFAVFRYGSKELPFVGALVGALIHSVLPLYYQNQANGNQALRNGSLKLIHVLFPITILLVWINPWLFPHLFSSAFQESAFLFNIYLLTLIPRLWLVHTILIARHEHRMMLIISVTELVINVVVSILAIQWIGMMGVALGTVVAFFYEKILMTWYLRRQGVKLNVYAPVKILAGYSTILFISVICVWWWWHG